MIIVFFSNCRNVGSNWKNSVLKRRSAYPSATHSIVSWRKYSTFEYNLHVCIKYVLPTKLLHDCISKLYQRESEDIVMGEEGLSPQKWITNWHAYEISYTDVQNVKMFNKHLYRDVQLVLLLCSVRSVVCCNTWTCDCHSLVIHQGGSDLWLSDL